MKKYKFDKSKILTNLQEDVEVAKTRDKELVAIGDSPKALQWFVDKNDFTEFTVSDNNEEFPYVSLSCGGCFSNIIFKSDLKEEEPKYRGFKDAKELFATIGYIGVVITYRFKDAKNKDTYYKEIINQIQYSAGAVYLKLHGSWFPLGMLFKELEIYINGEWRPFGAKEND